MEYGLDSVKTMMDKPQIQEVFMGRLAILGWNTGWCGRSECGFLPDKRVRREQGDRPQRK